MASTVFVTGAFGNIGSFVLKELLLQNYDIIAFDIKNPSNERNSKKFAHGKIQIRWGDITKAEDVQRAMAGAQAVIHLAGIFPPTSEDNQALAKAVNVLGTQNIIDAMEAPNTAKRLVFASSIAVYGRAQGTIPPPLNTSHPVAPGDYYGQTKADNEKAIKASSLKWSILRICACPPVNFRNMGSFMGNPVLDQHPDSRVEIIHPSDTALAFVNAVKCDEAINKVLLIGGGKDNQITTQQLFSTMLSSLGLKPLPREAFRITEKVDFHGDWLDTNESQSLLNFQRHNCETIFKDLKESFGLIKHSFVLLKLLSPIIYRLTLLNSYYYKRGNK